MSSGPDPRTLCIRAALEACRAVLFDMDGTLVEADYDWPAIRRTLGVDGPSIIDALDALPAARRERGWRRLREYEARATSGARLVPGARGLLARLRERGLKLALVTNNSAENTSELLRRFDLDFDCVMTRDSGLYKPSGRPITEALRRLRVRPAQAMVVGDTSYDLHAAGDAGCAHAVLLGPDRPGERPDWRFDSLAAFAAAVDHRGEA